MATGWAGAPTAGKGKPPLHRGRSRVDRLMNTPEQTRPAGATGTVFGPKQELPTTPATTDRNSEKYETEKTKAIH